MPKTTPSSVQNSAYFAGTTVDVSANYSSSSIVRCVRDNKNVEKTYPYLTNISGNPVIVSYEKVNGVEKGYVDVNPMTTGTYSYYRLGSPCVSLKKIRYLTCREKVRQTQTGVTFPPDSV